MTEFEHIPVLLQPVLELLRPEGCRRLVDGTLGGAGHAAALLAAAPADAELLGSDRDDAALAAARARLAPFAPRVHLVRGSYAQMAEFAAALGWEDATVDAILLDLGVSSPQIDTPDRGFAHRFDGPLDMRMDRRQRLTAATLLNHTPEAELARIFREYGEEPQARRLAHAIVERRERQPWERTAELAALVGKVAGRPFQRGLPAATRVFQALRIAVNGELAELRAGLAAALRLLRPGGRLAVISFHSLEDRIVKEFIRHEALSCVCPPGLPVCVCQKQATLRPVTKKPVTAAAAELAANRRAAPAKLRVAERLPVAAAPAPSLSRQPSTPRPPPERRAGTPTPP
ncbi:MAG: 16S rRNA (cytosine(1402)-N(4))-methyltransferase RsmH [Lentisphaeria bacterium]|jgi:16S rRNA (cytosine1402-N4)-methyltransferase